MSPDLHILVADDMEGMRRILSNSLHQMGVRNVMTASHGAEAWRMLQNHRFDALVTDWNMPHMSGLELLKAVRANAATSRLPVLMMTAESEKHQVEVAIRCGVSGYMVKPFTVGALEAKLRKILSDPLPGAQKTAGAEVAVLKVARAARTVPEPTTANAGDTLPTILCVDDVPDNLDVLVAALGDTYAIKVASSGERALKVLSGTKLPDLVLLDVMMPEMDGFEVCKRIKANPVTRDIPVIFLTAVNETVDVTRGLALGAVDYVTKPADTAILRARIETHLRLRRSVAELQRSRLELIEKNTILEENVRLRDEFERIAQHDLKNPIAGIVSFASSLLGDEALADQHKEILRYIEQSGYRVLDMVHMSLDLYKMERGTYVFEPTVLNVTDILQKIVKEMQSEMASRLIQAQFSTAGKVIEQPGAVPVLGDETLLYSLFGNLLRNSLEAAGENTAITIGLEIQEGQVLVAITNDGVVPPDVRATFFDKFATSGKPNGNGLGTFSAQLIARTHGGGIAMETSDALNTTTVTVSLPYGLQADLAPSPTR